ncbi:ankycorbin-like [Acanthaster planci]|uniref:Ankycorbin-like n=1 Tax=Acanthaster planci TaxID=133434 RepID=A0A8B7ZDL5_ACAPL|nr:ankycorbin-like [Acanthaster planci]XP_022102936.1 ankycorbin-like [Acanthaster planci]
MFKKLKKGRDKEGEWGKNDEKVMQAVEDGDIEKLLAALGKKGTSPIKMDPEGRVPLHLAAELGQFGCLDIMIQHGVTVAAADSQGYTVLHYACMGGHTDCVQRLVLANAPVNAKELTGKTALHLAVLGGHSDCCKVILKAKASVDVTEEYGKTALMMASQLGHLTICKDLIDKGANVNAQDHLQRTPLMMACESNHKEVVDLLVKRGARTDLTDAQGFDAAYYAEGSSGDDLKECLESAPSVATWDVKAHNETDDEPKADSIDYVDRFDAARCESPHPKSPRQQNGNLQEVAVVNPHKSAASTKSVQQSKEIKEMEEENEVLYEELSRLTLDHKKAQEKIKALEQQLQQTSMVHGDNLRNQEFEEEFEILKRNLQMEKDKRAQAETATEMLKARLASMGGDVTEDEIDSNWGDSDDDLFDLPGTGGSAVKVKSAKRIDTANRLSSESTGLVAILRSQIVSLRQENEELKKKNVANASTELDDSRVSQLEEELSSLRQELDAVNGRDVVNVEEYNELKKANRLELVELQKNNGILMEEIANMSQRLALSTDENERLKRKTMQDGQKMPTHTLSANSTLQRQYDNLLQEKRHSVETISKHSKVLAEKGAELDKLKAKCAELTEQNKQLKDMLSEKAQNGLSTTAEEYEALATEKARLDNMVAKQSKAIAQLNERSRRDKQKYTELLADQDKLRTELEGRENRASDDIDKDRYDDLIEENHRLRQSVKTQEAHLARSPDKDRFDHLTKENWRLQDEIRKQDDKMIELRQELRKLQQNSGNRNDNVNPHNLVADNQKLKDKIEKLEREESRRAEEARRFTELLAENHQLKRTVQEQAETFESQLPASVGFSKKRYTELLTENRKLKAQALADGGDGGGASRVSDLKEVIRLQQKLQEAEEKYDQMVSVYRAHLLNAIQDDLNPKVRDSLVKISKIRRGEEFV